MGCGATVADRGGALQQQRRHPWCVLMAFADHGLSFLAWEAAERAHCTTIQLNTHFLDAVKPANSSNCGRSDAANAGLVFMRG